MPSRTAVGCVVKCDQIFESGAYVLGILGADERTAYERHLATCAICQHEVADFSRLPDMLAQLDPDQVTPVPPVPAVPPTSRRPLPSVPRATPAPESRRPGSSRVERGFQRRRRRWQAATAALAAVACLALGVLVGARLINNPAPPANNGRMVAMQPVAASVPISAQVALNPFIGGTEVRMHCVYDGGAPAPRWTLKLFVYPKDGSAPEQVSTWTAAHGDDLTLSAATRLTPAEIAKVELRKGDDTSLLVYQNA
jgi:hypothetical protein